MNNTTNKKLFSFDFLFKSKFLSGNIIKPKRDWKILIALFLIFIIISIGFDFYMYKKIASGEMYVSINKTDLVIENLKTNDLKKILEDFETKKALMVTSKIQNLVDPSL